MSQERATADESYKRGSLRRSEGSLRPESHSYPSCGQGYDNNSVSKGS